MKLLLRLCLFTLILSTGLFFISHYLMELNATQALSQVIAKHSLLFMFPRYGLYIAALILWPMLIEWIGTRQNWQAQTIVYLSNQRIKVFCFFVIIEVLFVYNLIGHLIAWL